jgi:hypothetical protein
MLDEPFDNEFKLYLHNKGINIDNNIFDIKFNPPQNFASYRQAEMDTARVNTFNIMMAIPFVSKRFAMKRFLGMTAEEVAENETMWREENLDEDTRISSSAELRSAGITANSISSDISDLGNTEAPPPPPNSAESAAEGPSAPPTAPPV